MKGRAPLLCALALAAALGLVPMDPVAAQGGPVAAAPAEIEGQINGKPARFVAEGADILLSSAEADRIGLPYRGARQLSIGGTKLWVVTLASITVDKQTRLGASAGVVPDIAAYFAALRSHAAEAMALSREVRVEVNGQPVQAYDMGMGGYMMSIKEADRVGLPYRTGKRQMGQVESWMVETTVKAGAGGPPFPAILVTEPDAFFRMVQGQIEAARKSAPGAGGAASAPAR